MAEVREEEGGFPAPQPYNQTQGRLKPQESQGSISRQGANRGREIREAKGEIEKTREESSSQWCTAACISCSGSEPSLTPTPVSRLLCRALRAVELNWEVFVFMKKFYFVFFFLVFSHLLVQIILPLISETIIAISEFSNGFNTYVFTYGLITKFRAKFWWKVNRRFSKNFRHNVLYIWF